MELSNRMPSFASFILFIIVVDLTITSAQFWANKMPECSTPCSIPVRNSSIEDIYSANCEFIKDTFECEKRSRSLLSGQSDLFNQSCPSSKIQTILTPYVYDHPNYKAFLSLNVSLNIYDQTTRAVALRLVCLQSGAEKEFYCENLTRPAHWDRFYWPCRLFDFSEIPSTGAIYPIQFKHDCFRISSLSLFMINVTLYPQNCVASYVFRMPSFASVLAKDITTWLPLVTVDSNADDGIWIYYSPPPPSIRVRRVLVEIHEILPNSDAGAIRTVIRRRGVFTPPQTRIFFVDLPRGSYSAIVYAEHTSCEDEKCAQTLVPFNLTTDHYTVFTRQAMGNKLSQENAWVPVAAAIGGILIGFVVIALAVVAYLRWKANQRKRQPCAVSYVQFTRRPVILILYTNDSAQHRRCVLELATYLQNRANCEIELDEWAMTSTTTRKYRSSAEWLMQALQRADYYLIVFSTGGKETVFRNTSSSTFAELKSDRPWDEIFAPAINFVLHRLFQTARGVDAGTISSTNAANGGGQRPDTAFDRYICVNFSYSTPDAVPDLFRTLPCPKFDLPDELRHLVCHIHEWPSETVYENTSLDADRLNSSVSEASNFIDSNPNWLSTRLIERDGASGSGNDRQRITEISDAIDRLRGPTNAEVPENMDQYYSDILEHRNLAADGEMQEDKYLLIPPSTAGENENDQEADNRFDLIPPDDEELESLFYSHSDTSRSQR